MTRNLHHSLALLSLAATCIAFNTHAQQVTFQGTVAVVTCTANVTTGGGTVSLPTVTSDLLPSVTSTAGETTFIMAITGCGANPGVTAKTYFYNTTASAVDGGRLNTNPNRGWQFQILPATGTSQLNVGTSATPPAPSANNDPGASIASGSANITYRARYYRSAALTGGSASATANFVLQYI